MQPNRGGPRVNSAITAAAIRLIDERGANVGVVPREKALVMADEAGLDLVEISPQADPPVCKITDYGRFRNEAQKKGGGAGRKINHLSYIGDAGIGAGVNDGAGTITCNYDGKDKHKTKIGDGAFIGSGVELVAPVEIGAGATIGAGSTITKSAPDEQLTLERARQTSIKGWKKPGKEGTS